MWELLMALLRMGSQLLLLSSVLLSTCQVVESQRVLVFNIRSVTVTIEPGNSVSRGTNVTVRCQARISSDGSVNQEYTIYRDDAVVYTHRSNTTEDVLYHLPDARVANTGKYKCKVEVQDRELMSPTEKLTLTGLKTPVFRANKKVLSEGEVVKMWCSAPEETGTIMFTFYEDSKDLRDIMTNTGQAEWTHPLNSRGVHRLHCDYKVVLIADSVGSNKSNVVEVTVKELNASPVISVQPHGTKIIEGDIMTISCSVKGNQQNSSETRVLLLQGNAVLSSGRTSANHSMTALAGDSGLFECELQLGLVLKHATENVTITELFSKPVLVMNPIEVFEKEEFNLTCKSTDYSADRISASDIKYSIYKDSRILTPGIFHGVHVVPAGVQNPNGNYFCKAEARMVSKDSGNLSVKAKVLVSKPIIMSTGKVVVGKPFQVRCRSDRGSLPINYTLLRRGNAVHAKDVRESQDEAVFSITLQDHTDIEDYRCRAKNHRHALDSDKLTAAVIVPVSDAQLTISSDLSPDALNTVDIAEGYNVYLVCSVQGSHPISFKWYSQGNAKPLYTAVVNRTTEPYRISRVTKEHSGRYHCVANNPAERTAYSQVVTLNVRMSGLTKGLIVVGCLAAVVAVAVLAWVLRSKSKRGARGNAAELSVKPSSPKSDDSLTVSLTHDTMEVYTPPKVGAESAGSVWSERPVDPDSDLESNNELDVEYAEVVHHKPEDSDRVPLRKGTDTVYSEVQNSPTGPFDDQRDHGSLEYADLNITPPEVHHARLEIHHDDLPVVVE